VDYIRRPFGILDRLTGESVAVFCGSDNRPAESPGQAYEIARVLGLGSTQFRAPSSSRTPTLRPAVPASPP
jgi:hypothetical protein